MTRRHWMLALAAGVPGRGVADRRDALVPLDEASFRQMVANHRGKVLLVDFWATWCGPCREEMPPLVALSSARKQRGFELITVSCDEPEQEGAAADFLAQQHAPTPRYIRRTHSDDAFINSIDPKWSGALPALFLFDRSGRQLASLIGEVQIKQIEAAVEKALS
ncbi:MAG: TlpA family protein disulfide reductase [Acidobacteriaceae bacterium]|nr:TlpA family protein disulfide reductase [Acidobacteriaceae bacterium]